MRTLTIAICVAAVYGALLLTVALYGNPDSCEKNRLRVLQTTSEDLNFAGKGSAWIPNEGLLLWDNGKFEVKLIGRAE